jgi:hypothetical protein
MNPFEGIKPEGQVQAGIEIDPDVLKKIQSMRKGKCISGFDESRAGISFAGSVTETYVHRVFLKNLVKMGIDAFKQKMVENREMLNKSFHTEIPENVEDIKDSIVGHLLFDLMMDISSLSRITEIEELINKEFFKDYISGKNPEAKDETVSAMMKLLKEELEGKTVVDLGSGRSYFRFAASLCGAEEYAGIDLPYNEKNYGKEEEIPYRGDVNRVFFPTYKPCKARKINMDILEALYTKIPDSSSSFVIFGVDETYDLKGDYINLTNETIAKKTAVGGIVVCVNSVIGIDMQKNENFEVIHEGAMTTVYKRVK